MKFCGPLRQEHRNSSTEVRRFLRSDRCLCSHNGWLKVYMPHCKIRDRSLLLPGGRWGGRGGLGGGSGGGRGAKAKVHSTFWAVGGVSRVGWWCKIRDRSLLLPYNYTIN